MGDQGQRSMDHWALWIPASSWERYDVHQDDIMLRHEVWTLSHFSSVVSPLHIVFTDSIIATSSSSRIFHLHLSHSTPRRGPRMSVVLCSLRPSRPPQHNYAAIRQSIVYDNRTARKLSPSLPIIPLDNRPAGFRAHTIVPSRRIPLSSSITTYFLPSTLGCAIVHTPVGNRLCAPRNTLLPYPTSCCIVD